MKKFCTLLLLLLSTLKLLNAAIGCMDNSKHAQPCSGYDYKTYHYVYCTCPCERYTKLFDRGRCMRCGHFREPDVRPPQ